MRQCGLRAAIALVCILCAPLAGSEGPRWLKVTSPNFEIFTTAGERSGRDVARHFEQVRGFFAEAMGLGTQPGPPVRIVVFRTDKEYAPYSPNDFATAFYLGTDDRDYIIMKSASSEHFPIAVHEYTHLLVKHSGIAVPVWFNEGLAELYSNLKPLAGKVEVGDFIMPHFTMLRSSKWIDLATLVAVGHDSPLYNEKSHAGLFYAESWALVHMLYLGKDYRPHLPALLAGIKSGAPMSETFQKAYGKSVAEVQSDLVAYMRATTFSASLYNTKLPKAADTPEVAESDPLEIGLVLAEVLAHIQAKAAQGREAYERLAHDYPKDWRAEEGLARLSWRELKREEAIGHYARAAALGATDPKMYLVYGQLLRMSDRRPEAVAALKRATELDPGYLEAHLELGFADLADEHFDDALAQFHLMKNVTPEQAFGYFHAMAYTYYRLGRKEEARTSLAQSRKYAKTSEQVEQMNHLTDALDYVGRVAAQTEPEDEAERPRQVRRPGGREATAVAEGTLQQIDCMGGKIRVRIAADGTSKAFAILDADAVRVKDAATPVELACGPQAPKRIRIEYEPRADVMPGTLGLVRSLEFPE